MKTFGFFHVLMASWIPRTAKIRCFPHKVDFLFSTYWQDQFSTHRCSPPPSRALLLFFSHPEFLLRFPLEKRKRGKWIGESLSCYQPTNQPGDYTSCQSFPRKEGRIIARAVIVKKSNFAPGGIFFFSKSFFSVKVPVASLLFFFANCRCRIFWSSDFHREKRQQLAFPK